MTDRRMLALEAATVLFIAGLALWSVRPLLEEWGTLNAFKDAGLFYPWGDMLRVVALRPLHMAGYLLQWLLGGGTPIGVAIAAMLVMVARYAVVRWAVTPFVGPVERWVVATFGAVLFAWPAAWFGRYVGAQISSVLFFVAVGFALRLTRKASAQAVVFGSLSTFAALLFYQALAVAMLLAAVLCAALAWRQSEPDQRYSRALYAAAPFILGLSAYALYAVVVRAVGLGTYEAHMVGQPLSLAFVASRISAVYMSAFGGNPLTAPLFLAVATGFLLCAAASSTAVRGTKVGLAMLAVLLLPLLSLVYLNLGHAGDLDRTLFPVSVGFVLVLIAIAVGAGARAAPALPGSMGPGAALVTLCLFVSIAFAHQARTYWVIQSSVIVQLLRSEFRASNSVLLKDATGLLGDTYTFHMHHGPEGVDATSLGRALRLYGLDINISLCTPSGTDRLHVVAQRQSLPTTARCEDERDPGSHDMVLLARNGPNGIVVALEPTRRIERGKPVAFDDTGAGEAMIVDGWSGQEAEFRWSEGPRAALAVEFIDDGGGDASLVLTLDPFLGGGLPAQHVAVDIDGVHAGDWQVDRRGEYSIAIPPETLDDGRLAIVLSVSDPTEPCKVMATGDCRPLGVAIRALAIN